MLLFFILPIGLVVVVTFFNYLDAATSLQDLSRLRSVGLHKLKGDRKAQWAMTVRRTLAHLLPLRARRRPRRRDRRLS